MTTGQQTWPKQGARPAILPACQPQLERSDRDQIAFLVDRCVALERDRALLLRFARAEKRCRTTPLDMPDHTYWEDAELELRDAWNSVQKSGLLEGDDDGE